MKISFEILDSEAQCIAEHHGFDPNGKQSLEEFVNENFKNYGRTCLISKMNSDAMKQAREVQRKSVESIKASVSF